MAADKSATQGALPLFSEATQAAAKMFSIGRDLAILNAELKAAEQTQRVVWAAVTLVFALLFLFLPIFWITTYFHERGFSALGLSGTCAFAFGLLAVFSGWKTRKAFVNKTKRRQK